MFEYTPIISERKLLIYLNRRIKNILCIYLFFYFFDSDIEVSNRHGHTCLMIACYKGHYLIAKYLLALKADVNRKSVKGNTALHDCAESGNLEILKLLIEHGAKMDVDSYGTCNFRFLHLFTILLQLFFRSVFLI